LQLLGRRKKDVHRETAEGFGTGKKVIQGEGKRGEREARFGEKWTLAGGVSSLMNKHKQLKKEGPVNYFTVNQFQRSRTTTETN